MAVVFLSPGCIHGVAACSYITARLIVEYSYTSNETTNNCKAIRARIVHVGRRSAQH